MLLYAIAQRPRLGARLKTGAVGRSGRGLESEQLGPLVSAAARPRAEAAVSLRSRDGGSAVVSRKLDRREFQKARGWKVSNDVISETTTHLVKQVDRA